MRLRLPETWTKTGAGRKQYFDEDLSQDAIQLLEAAALLEIKEIELFELAYKEWYGKKPIYHVIDAHFANYMFHNVVPVWVRNYARHVLDLEGKGELYAKDLGIYQPLPSKKLILIGKSFSLALLLVFVIILILIYDARDSNRSLFGRADSALDAEQPVHNAMP